MARPRILGGVAKGTELRTPGPGTRPSPARLREAVFDALQFVDRGPFLDLYAGSGALGLEAASRGFDAVLVESNPRAARVARDNAARAKLAAQVVTGDALAYARAHPGAFVVTAAAPPYPDDLTNIFRTILAAGPVASGGRYLFQHPSALNLAAHLRDELLALGLDPDADGTAAGPGVRSKRYGSNAVTWIALLPGGGSVGDGVFSLGW